MCVKTTLFWLPANATGYLYRRSDLVLAQRYSQLVRREFHCFSQPRIANGRTEVLIWSHPCNLRSQNKCGGERNKDVFNELSSGAADRRSPSQADIRTCRSATEPEVAAELGIPLHEYQVLLRELRGLDLGCIQAGSEQELNEYIPDARQEDPFTLCIKSEMKSGEVTFVLD
jgi:hypothetical protein